MTRSLFEEAQWLVDNPAFDERPATLVEFLGENYLDCEKYVRPRIRQELSKIMGEDVNPVKPTTYSLAMITGGIGIGKTTVASIVMPYLVHWVLCLKDPQEFFSLMPGSRIAFMQMSTSEKQAKEVIFADIKARISHSPWFKNHPYDPNFTTQLRFEKDIWILPGDSAETTFEGYNIMGGILDEADSHKKTLTRDYAEQGYTTISARITSRFHDRGFLLVIGQMKQAVGFAAKKYAELSADRDAYAVRLAIWDSFGWEHYADPKTGVVDFFFYDTKRKQLVPKEMAVYITENDNLIKVPMEYRKDFQNDPAKAMRDLAGIPPAVTDPFILLIHKVDEAEARWDVSHDKLGSPMSPDGVLAPWLVAREGLKRTAHLDLAYSANGDALGVAMGHVREVVERDGEFKPYIVIDFLWRLRAKPGSEIFLGDVRRMLYHLAGTGPLDRKFKIATVSMDGFQSTDTRQQLERKRFGVLEVSMDSSKLPYTDLQEALYEDRIEFPRYLVHLRNGDTDVIDVLRQELSELTDTGRKIDHPVNGSKDLADAVAGVVTVLMGDRSYRQNVISMDLRRQRLASGAGMMHPAYTGDSGVRAPIPPTLTPTGETQRHGSPAAFGSPR